MTTIERLDGHRRLNRLTVEVLCRRAGMSQRTYYRRLTHPDELTVGEIRKLRNALRITEAMEV